MKIKKTIPYLLPLLLIIIIMIVLFALFKSSTYTAVIKDKTKTYYTARSVLIIGNNLICYKGTDAYKTKRIAYTNINDTKKLTIMKMSDILLIEIVPDPEEEEIDPNWIEYLGNYRVHVSGHIGYLYLRIKDNKPYGSIRFPEWANGVHEPLKRLRINRKKNTIYFVRSVTTLKELKRVGANSYFVQKYFARYKYNGRVLKGFYKNQGARSSWEGEKLVKK